MIIIAYVNFKVLTLQIRSCVAYALSAIAHWDWPEQWPELFGTLMQTLTSGNSVAVQGTMRVLTG